MCIDIDTHTQSTHVDEKKKEDMVQCHTKEERERERERKEL